jgi:hypothetical protein
VLLHVVASDDDGARRDALAALHQLSNAALPRFPGRLRASVGCGPLAQAIAAAARTEGADLLILDAPTLAGMKQAARESLVRDLAGDGSCAVLVVPAAPRPRPRRAAERPRGPRQDPAALT